MIALLFGLLIGFSDLDQAERMVRAGRYGEAHRLYRAALSEEDVPQGPVLYNLGNCAYRLGRYAEAMHCYQRALLRMPRDREVKFNLGLAEQQLGLDAPATESFGAAMEALADSFTPGEFMMMVGGLQGVGLVGFVLLRRRRVARDAMALLVLLGLAGGARLLHTEWFAGPPAGVVLAEEISLRIEPHTDLPATTLLKAGETVRVEELSDRWVRVVHPRGGGWTERAGIGVVD